MPEPTTPLAERPWESVERMLDVDSALERVLGAFSPLPAVELPLLDASGLVLAEDAIASDHVPPFRNSARATRTSQCPPVPGWWLLAARAWYWPATGCGTDRNR